MPAASASASISGAVEHDRAARLDRERAAAHLGDRPDRLRADRRAGRSAGPGSACTPSPRRCRRSPSWPARRMVASVPSMPSTATTALPRTTTLWPMSNCPMTLAARNPKWMSAHSSGVGGRADEHALGAGRSPADRASTRRCAMPSLSSSSASARSSTSSRSVPHARDEPRARAHRAELAEQARLGDAAHHHGAAYAGLLEGLDDRLELRPRAPR